VRALASSSDTPIPSRSMMATVSIENNEPRKIAIIIKYLYIIDDLERENLHHIIGYTTTLT
jgi:hypothetical protein